MPRPDSYHELLALLEDRGTFHIRPGLERVVAILDVLGKPQNRIPTVHIAGTNGKGSVAATLESVLRASGYRTALYTSPHLIEWLERYQIDGKPIAPELFLNAAQQVLSAESQAQTLLTHFEFLTVTAFVLFAQAPVDILILETGMGGRWDATNVINRPLVSVITSIGLDHMAWLGADESQIAEEKAGIIKSGVPTVSGVRGPGQTVITIKARSLNSPLRQLDQDVKAESRQTDWVQGRQTIRLKTSQDVRELSYRLLGPHQIDNAAVAFMVLEELKRSGWKITPAAVASGFNSVDWPGRFQMVSRSGKPSLLLDGAHNPHAMRQFFKTLEHSTFKTSPKTFVFSAYGDKEFHRMAQMISPWACSIVLTELPGVRAASMSDLRQSFSARPEYVYESPTVEAALIQADTLTPPDGLVVVTGSLALVGLALKHLQHQDVYV